jgi:ribosomal protein S27E
MLLSDKYFPTLDEFESAGRKLEVGCYHCGNVVRIRPSSTGLRLKLTVSEAADRVSCPRCGKSNNGRYDHVYGQPARRSQR